MELSFFELSSERSSLVCALSVESGISCVLSKSGRRLSTIDCEVESVVGESLQAYKNARGVNRVSDSKKAVNFFVLFIIKSHFLYSCGGAFRGIEYNIEDMEVQAKGVPHTNILKREQGNVNRERMAEFPKNGQGRYALSEKMAGFAPGQGVKLKKFQDIFRQVVADFGLLCYNKEVND